jgi:S-adenosylmethionine:tRNA ribosyltransferase-isomerase
MKLSHFKYFLPEERVALNPTEERDEARLMVLHRKSQTIEHKTFRNLLDYFDEGDLFVINNTKVFPALLFGWKEKAESPVRVFLLRELDAESRLWDVLVDPARKIRIGNKIYFNDDESLVAEVIDNTTSRGRTLRFLFDGTYQEFRKKLKDNGHTPLPDDIQALRNANSMEKILPEDEINYQTLYASQEGAVAAPTSGFHFSRELVKLAELKGIDFTELTLHAGLGNFREIDVEDLTKHKPDSEQVFISEETTKKINDVIDSHHKVCLIGTTVLKALESAIYTNGHVKSFDGWTNRFIFPPYNVTIGHALVSNFHAPMSSMLMAVCAFGGYDFIMKAYKTAIEEKYRFLTYGDAMLIL